jgi:hypothetical protein
MRRRVGITYALAGQTTFPTQHRSIRKSFVTGGPMDHGLSRAVELQETIARGDAGCRVVVHLRPAPAAMAAEGREHFRTA